MSSIGNAEAVPEWLRVWPVNNKVGDVRNTGAELMLPIAAGCLMPGVSVRSVAGR
jgi:hypothetical protein